MRLLAEEAGQVIVTLNVTWLHNGVERVLTDSMTVQVGFVCACTHAHTCLAFLLFHAGHRLGWRNL